ncbi:HlyC/CorC family transporter [Candidatus Acetothermia bacterium]|nr:HlyC/CorC family transporter [Candidatus Acetothermia bacterium]MBI3643077.1 HlyC/CorC family transporter [Candidatus Acetothermia bacterium]
MDPAVGFLCLVLLTLFSSFLTTLEIAIASLGRVRITALQKEYPARRPLLQQLLTTPALVLASISFLRDLALIGGGLIALSVTMSILPWSYGFTALVAVAVSALFVLLFREIFPKYLGREQMGSWVVRYLGIINWLTGPLVPLMGSLHNLGNLIRSLFRLPHQEEKRRAAPVSEEQIRYLLEAAEEHGLLEKEEQRMIWRILSYDDRVARQVMVPRPEVIAIAADTTIDQVREIVQEHGHSRYPIYEGTRDNVVGVLYAKDLLGRGFSDEILLRDLIRQPFFIPTIKPINDLLREIQRNKKHMAIVVDEFGSMAGIVTLEDILEEIVGEIADEFDQQETPIRKISRSEYLVDGDAELRQINEELVLNLPMDGAVTIGGLITQELEEIPQSGRKITLDGVTLTVENATAREILKVRIQLPEIVSSQNVN